jgi:hypothetical protein
MSNYYTYPVHGFGFMPNPDSAQDHETLGDAYAAFLGDIDVTVETAGTATPEDIPPMMACADGVVYGHSGWLHVIGKA